MDHLNNRHHRSERGIHFLVWFKNLLEAKKCRIELSHKGQNFLNNSRGESVRREKNPNTVHDETPLGWNIHGESSPLLESRSLASLRQICNGKSSGENI